MWVEPFFTCGECGGEIGRWPMRNLLKQDILDWRHRTVPDGIAPHRAVLGTPVPLAVIVLATPAETPDEPEAEPYPAPEVPARPALAADLPSAAAALDKLADQHGWTVEAWYMRGTRMDSRGKPTRVVSSVVLRMHRDGHRLVAVWEEGKFDTGYNLTHYAEMIGSAALKELIRFPRMICEDCKEPPALHVGPPGALVCYSQRDVLI